MQQNGKELPCAAGVFQGMTAFRRDRRHLSGMQSDGSRSRIHRTYLKYSLKFILTSL